MTSKFKTNDIDLMYYFLDQGKYTVEIMKRFRMMEWKSMATPMVMSINFLNDSSSYLVDTMMYRQLIKSLMYQVNIRLDT